MWPYPRVIAHRGAGILAPENTLAALRSGLARGFHAVEFDVMLSQDEVPVLMHDPSLGRTVGGSGRVADYTARQLAQMDAGSWFHARFGGEPVPTLEQALAFCSRHRIWMNIEIKPAPGDEARTGRLVARLLQRLLAQQIAAPRLQGGASSLPLFSSFSFQALMAAREEAPGIPRGYLMDAPGDGWDEALPQLAAVSLHVNHRNLDASQARAVKEAGYGLMCYTVNQPARAREILAWGVDAFCTDRIDLFDPDFAA